jgi:hypothetical protein
MMPMSHHSERCDVKASEMKKTRDISSKVFAEVFVDEFLTSLDRGAGEQNDDSLGINDARQRAGKSTEKDAERVYLTDVTIALTNLDVCNDFEDEAKKRKAE